MKYYTSNLWSDMQASATKDIAFKQWTENDKIYAKYFNEIKDCFPKSFLKIFLKEHGFHDFFIDGITIKSIKRKTISDIINIIISISNRSSNYDIELKNIENTNINIINLTNCIFGKMSWGYSEFEILENNKFKLSVLCDIVNEFEFVFSKISIRRQAK